MTQPGDELGAFTQARLIHHAAVADLFSALDQIGRPVVLVALTPEASADQAWRAAFADLVNRDRSTVNVADPQFVAAHAGDLQGQRPWVASRFEPNRRGIERILSVIPEAVPPGMDPSALIESAVFSAAAPIPPPQQYSLPQGQPGPSYQPAAPHYPPGGYSAPGSPEPYSSTPFSSPPQPGAGYPPPGPPDGSSRSRAGLLIGLITAVTALVIVAAGFAVVFINSGDDQKNIAVPPPKPTSASPLPAETAAPTPTPSRSPLPSTTPTIRTDVQTVSVVGPTWQNSDKTQLLDLTGWPFAFRLPAGWSCLRGTADSIPDANAWGCVKTEGASHQQRLNIILRRCPTICTASEQETMNEAWFDDEEEPNVKKFDAATSYIEIPKNKDGFYAVDFSHFLADKPGGTLTYQVGLWFQSPAKYKEEMQKSLNDVRTQAPQP